MPENINELLEKLGLTEYESKTLSSLFQLKEAKAPEISRDAQVPKTRVYDVLDRLVERSLVIEIQGRPKRYRSIEAEKALRRLVEDRRKEIEELERKAMRIKDKFDSGNYDVDAGEKVMKVKDKNDFIHILAQEIKNADNSIVAFSTEAGKSSALKKAITEAKKGKISVKMLHSQPEDIKELAREGIDARHSDHGLDAFIIDNQKVILALSDFKKEKPEYHFTIWHSKPMVDALKGHFDKIWEKGK